MGAVHILHTLRTRRISKEGCSKKEYQTYLI